MPRARCQYACGCGKLARNRDQRLHRHPAHAHAMGHTGRDRRIASVLPLPMDPAVPDAPLDTSEGDSVRPDARIVSRETIELAFLATIQLLPVKQTCGAHPSRHP